MGRLSRFLRLPRGQRVVHLEAVVLDATFRLLVLAAPFSVSRSLAQRLSRFAPRGDAIFAVQAVKAAGRVVPGSNCLSEALAAWVLLAKAEGQPTLRIGVANQPKFEAHAWVEYEGRVVIGDDSAHRFHPLQGPDLMGK